MINDIQKELEDLKDDIQAKIRRAAEIEKSLKDQETKLGAAADFLSENLGNVLEKSLFLSFFKKPYVVIPYGKNKVLVAVPKFIKGFQVGWLWKDTDNYYIYQFDQYSSWLGDAPKELLEQINFRKELDVQIEGNTLYFNPEWKEAVKKKLGHHLKDMSENQATVMKSHIFDLIVDTIESGSLPFKPREVSKDDIRPGKLELKLRPYQKYAYDEFMNKGAVGVFHPTGAGKSIIALAVMDVVKGPKLLVVPTVTLVEQWNYYIERYVPHVKDEIKITTYQGYRNADEEYSVVFYDECQRLPADTFSRLAVIKTKYRMGLSATPHREDGRESYIFALTGFPIGLNWQEYMDTVGKKYHPIRVHVVKSITGKMGKLNALVDMKKKTLIFCDTIDLGKRIASELGIPYIYGQSTNRLNEIETNKVVAISRVGDMGISIKGLQRIIEVDFLFGSRQQELQRTGRLMHSEDAERHDIIMTESEMQSYGKRLFALTEKGFTVKVMS